MSTNIIGKTKGKKKNLSLIFLILVIFSTFALYMYNGYLEDNNNKLSNKITNYNSNIDDFNKEKNIQVYNILGKNKSMFEEMDKNNKIVSYINHLSSLEAKYSLKFNNFNFANGDLSTNVTVSSTEEKVAFNLTKNFISEYRNDEKSLFTLNFINSVSGMDNMKFNTNFTLK